MLKELPKSKYMVDIILLIIIILIISFICNKTTEHFRSNKCFSCERDIPYLDNPNMAFSSKCFDCENGDILSKRKYFEMYNKNKFLQR